MLGIVGRWLPLGLGVLLAVIGWVGLSADPHHVPFAQAGRALPPFQLPGLNAATPGLSSNDLQGHLSLLNVWASWCDACTEEQVFLLQLAESGVPIYGLNYRDNSEQARRWLKKWGNPYRQIGHDKQGKH